MVVDRAKNTLRQARKLTIDETARDFVGQRDRDDLYRISFQGRSQFSLQLGGVQKGAKLMAEVFALKNGTVGKIDRINFSNLTRRQFRQNLTRLGSSSKAINLTLDSGSYYLRISPQRGDSRYRLTVNAQPISPSSPNPLPNPTTPDPTPSAATFTRAWVRQFGTSGNDYAYGTAIDSSGNVYVSGTTPNAINNSTTDAFVAKYDPSGNQVWLRSFGATNASDTAFDVAVDVQGNYYVVGATNISLNNPFTANSDGFIAKYDANGNQLWQQPIDSTVSVPLLGQRSGLDAATGIAIDGAGNAYVSGFTKAFPAGNDKSQAFVAKYTTNGAREWLTEYGSSAADGAADVALDSAGNVYITGIRNADLTTNADDPFTGGDAFVAKFNKGGVQQWNQTLGTTNTQDYARSIAVTASGTVYITGQTDGTLAGQTAGGRDGFLARYSTDGALVWTRQFGTASLDESQGVAIAPDGSIYLTGETSASLFGQTDAGGSDSWFAQYAPSGDRLSAQQFGTAQDDEAYNLTLDGTGNLYVIGQTLGAIGGTANAGSYDAWVAKYTL